MSESELASHFEEATYHVEHHNQDLNFVGKYALSEVPRRHGYKVVLTGEGSDEHFAGYPLYLPDYLREPDGWLDIPDEEREGIVEEQEDLVRQMYTNIGGTTEYFGSNRGSNRELNLTTPASMLAFTPPLSIFSPHIREQFAKINPLDTVTNNIDGLAREKIRDGWHPLNSAMYVWTKGHLVNQFLSCLGDRVEMAHSIEARTPFLDHKLTEYVNNLPPNVKIRSDGKGGYIEKWVLREAVKGFVTPEIYTRRKHAYAAPTSYDIDGPVRKMLDRLVTKEGVESLGFLDWEVVERLMKRAWEGKGDARSWRVVLIIAGWVVLGRRFQVRPAVRGQRLRNGHK